MRTVLVLLVAALVAISAGADPQSTAESNCNLTIVQSLPLEFDDTGRVSVPVAFNDKPHRMMVDTGAEYSVMTKHAADQLGLKISRSRNFFLVVWGGFPLFNFTEVDSFALGRQRAGKTTFMVSDMFGASDGLLGADFLYYFDLDFDFAKSKLNLISPKHCKGKAVYWSSGDYGTVPFKYEKSKIVLDVLLDGKKVEAILDTGAHDTVMSLEEAADLYDWDKDVLAKAKTRQPFKTMSFGAVLVNNPSVKLVADRESGILGSGSTKMIIGMSVLRRLHLYIAYKEEKLYVTPAMQYGAVSAASASAAP